MAEDTTLGLKEYGSVSQALFDLIHTYSGFPTNTQFDFQDIGGVNRVGFLTDPSSSKYIRRNVHGGFSGQVPFRVFYVVGATGNRSTRLADDVLTGLSEYLESISGTELSGGRVIEEIEMDSTPYRAAADKDGGMVFGRAGVMIYKKEVN